MPRPAAASAASPADVISLSGWTSNFSREGYERMVREVIERILSGDIFQANMAQRFEAPAAARLRSLRLLLRACASAIRRLSPPISAMASSPSSRPRRSAS